MILYTNSFCNMIKTLSGKYKQNIVLLNFTYSFSYKTHKQLEIHVSLSMQIQVTIIPTLIRPALICYVRQVSHSNISSFYIKRISFLIGLVVYILFKKVKEDNITIFSKPKRLFIYTRKRKYVSRHQKRYVNRINREFVSKQKDECCEVCVR